MTDINREMDWAIGRDMERKDAELSRLRAEIERLRALFREIAPIMRYEHDAGDGHFSTDQVEAVENAAQDSGNR